MRSMFMYFWIIFITTASLLFVVENAEAENTSFDKLASYITDTPGTQNARNEYAHERNLRLSKGPVKNIDGTTRIGDDSSRAGNGASVTRAGMGISMEHHVSGASR